MSVATEGTETAHAAEEPFSLLPTGGFFTRLESRLGFDPRKHPIAQQGARVASYLLITWVAPMVLASVEPARHGALSFMADFETHLRSLVAIPLLLFAESRVDREVKYIVRSLGSPRRCRNSEGLRARVRSLRPLIEHPLVGAGLVLLALLIVPTWIRHHTSGRETWIFVNGARPTLTAAGTWQAYVVVPVYVFLLLRWLWRWLVLMLVFARSASLLRPIVSRGDRCGGFSFVSRAPGQFAWVIAGASSLVSARWLFAVVCDGVPAAAVTKPMLGILILSVLIAFFPLLGFAFHFAQAKRSGLRHYRAVVEGHASNVEREWFRRPFPAHVTSEESSSLTDLNSVYDVVRTMQIIPYRRAQVSIVLLAAIIPMLPVLSFIAPIDEILRGVFKALL